MNSKAESRAFPPGKRIGVHEIVACIGAGGMGEVFRARDTRLNRAVAIKVLPVEFAADPARLERFEAEARTLAALNHPHILVIHDIGTEGGAPYLVSELLEGQTLREALKNGPLTPRKATDYALQMASGLAAAHAKGIVHRDLKPENVFITEDGRVKILDFGLAKLKAGGPGPLSDPEAATLVPKTEPGVVMGTAGYMSPEQVSAGATDHRSDIFSFGAIFYEMLSGRRAFRKDSGVQTMHAILAEEPLELLEVDPTLPPAIDRVVRRCLEKRPERRFQSATDLAFAIENSTGASSSRSLPPLLLGGGWRDTRSVWAAGGALGAALLTALLMWRSRSVAPGPLPANHLTVALPEGLTLAPGLETLITLSPDGSRVVYTGTGTNGTSQLWEQPLGQPNARPIPGTEGGDSPFFSPDGRWLGFHVDGTRSLMKISVEGGSPLTVWTSVEGSSHGAAWGRDGNIYCAPGWSLGIWKIDGEGKRPAVRVVNAGGEDRAVIWPSLLPDGQTLLYTVWTGGTFETAKLVVHSLVTRERREIVRGAQGGRYVNSGHILFAREGSVYALPFDAKRLVATGPERLILPGVAMGAVEGEVHLGVSDNGSLVYLPGGPITHLWRMEWLDRQGHARPAIDWSAAADGARLSPDGQSLVTQVGAAGKMDVYTYDLVRGTPNKISSSADDYWPMWTPDGQRIIFVSGRRGGQELFWRAADGSGPEEQLTSSEGAKSPESISPDGKLLLFTWQRPESSDVWVLPLTGERKPFGLLTNSWNESRAVISPDGKWLAYRSDESGRDEIYVQSYPAGANRRQLSNEGGDWPLWSRNGRELFYQARRKLVAVESVESGAFVPGKPKVLFEGDFNPHYDISLDGKELLVGVRDIPGFTRFRWVQNWLSLTRAQEPRRTE